MIYFTIFISKIIENALSTLRIILVSNGKKKIGAILQGLVMLVWILVTGYVVTNITKDSLQIIFLCLGAIVGSYLGSILEEKIALGTVKLSVITDKKKEIYKCLHNQNKYYDKYIIIITKRKNINNIINTIKSIDNKSIIISEKIKTYDKSPI